jgi:hypothetical protein
MTELESLQQLFKGVKDTDYIVKRVLEYKSEFEVCEDCKKGHYLPTRGVVCNEGIKQHPDDNNDIDFGCNKWEGKENES